MDRRNFLFSAAAFALPVPAGDSIGFKVLRNGGVIGEHHIGFNQSGATLTATITIDLLVRVAMIPVFRYGLNATETWSGGVFQSLDSQVNFNGDHLSVQAEKTADGYAVEGINHDNTGKSLPRYIAPPDMLPLTYWNKAMLNGTILNVQTAHCYKVNVASPGWDRLPTASGGSITAQRYDLTGKLVLSVWYDSGNAWSGLEFHKSGEITYQKITA